MGDTFHPKRFLQYLKKTLIERQVQTSGVTGLMLALSLITYIFLKLLFGFGAAQNITFIWGLAAGDVFLASFVFGYFGSNASGTSYLMLPVSYFEKWLAAIIIVGVMYPVVFILFFHAMDSIFVAAYHRSLDPASIFYREKYDQVFTFDVFGMIAWKVYIIWFFCVSAMLTGGTYFNKASLVKTLISFCIILGGIFCLNWLTADILFPNVADAWPYDHVELFVGKETGVLLLPRSSGPAIRYGVVVIIPAILWLIPLVRLREKEF